MNGATVFRSAAQGFNRFAALPFLRTRAGKSLLGGSFATLTYTGRRSGRQVTLPVNYRRRGDDVVVGVAAPGSKTWWRNFTGAGGPITVQTGDDVRAGHAVANRRDGKVRVTITFEATGSGPR